MELKDLVEGMVKAMVNKPDEALITELKGGHVTVYELMVAKEDMGIIIGKEGRTADAMRTILTAASKKLKRSVLLNIAE